MKKLTTLWDVDDVLWPLVPKWIQTLNHTYGTTVSPECVTEWEIEKFFPSLTKEQVFAPLLEDWFWADMQPADDAVEVLTKVKNDGHKVKLVTATDYRNVPVKVKRLLEIFPMITWDDIIITSDKQSVKGDVLTDDGPHNLIGGEYYKILISKPHNKSIETERSGVNRVNTLTEAYGIIERLAQDDCEYYMAYNGWKKCFECKHHYEDDGALYCRLKGRGEFSPKIWRVK